MLQEMIFRVNFMDLSKPLAQTPRGDKTRKLGLSSGAFERVVTVKISTPVVQVKYE